MPGSASVQSPSGLVPLGHLHSPKHLKSAVRPFGTQHGLAQLWATW